MALSAEGNTALIGGTGFEELGSGVVWVFSRLGSVWTQQQSVTGAGAIGASAFGFSTALASDGTVLIGGPRDHSGVGAAWVFQLEGSVGPPPAVTGLSAKMGPVTGGTPVTIAGTGFTGVSAVKFGSHEATIESHSETAIGVRSPAVTGPGTAIVTVTTPNGTSPSSGRGAKKAKFKYKKAKK